MTLPSYTRGLQDKPLLAMTIGAAFDQTVARFAEREALVVRHQHIRYSWAQLAEQVERCARALLHQHGWLQQGQPSQALGVGCDGDRRPSGEIGDLHDATPARCGT